MIDIGATFITFFAVVDPIGTVPVFIAVTSQFDESAKRKIALIATVAAALILLFFVVAGEIILFAMAIPLSAFQIAGGIVLFIFALTMIFGESKPDSELRLAQDQHERAIFPLAVPSIASPGAMLAAVLLTENDRFSIPEQIQTFAVLLSVLALAYVLMLLSSSIQRILGKSGPIVVSRIMGLILSAVATTSFLAGVDSYFGLA